VYETVARGEVALLNEGENKTVTAVRAPKGKDRHRLTCMGSHKGAKGLVLFGKMDAVNLLSAAWWFDQAAGYRLPNALSGQCYFVAFREMLAPTSMDEFSQSKDKQSWVVRDSDVSIFWEWEGGFSPVTAEEEAMCIQSDDEEKKRIGDDTDNDSYHLLKSAKAGVHKGQFGFFWDSEPMFLLEFCMKLRKGLEVSHTADCFR
jgi:hypothetical protein